MIPITTLRPMSQHLVRLGPRQWNECGCEAQYSHLAGQEQEA